MNKDKRQKLKFSDKRRKQMQLQKMTYMKKLKQEMRGKDTESVRGSIPINPNSGTYEWTLRWNHEPARQGAGDSFGLCGEACEQFGPTTDPCLGDEGDGGVTIGLYANGKLIHK